MSNAPRDRLIRLVVAALSLATLVIDILTPLGYAEWSLYFLVVGLTMFQSSPRTPFAAAAASSVLIAIGAVMSPPGASMLMAYVNRGIGVASFWIMAIVVAHALRARRHTHELLWLQETKSTLAAALRGDRSLQAIAEASVRVLAERLGMQVGALYRLDGRRLQLEGGIGLPPSQPASCPADEGLLAEALHGQQPRRVPGLGRGHLTVVSGLGQSEPVELQLAPLSADGALIGVIELGRVGKAAVPWPLAQQLLDRVAEPIGIAVRTALYREQLVALLEETQQQSEELQAQQEELRVANEELEEQSRSLQLSQASLEAQQAELEQTNTQLEERTHELELQRRSLLDAQVELERRADQLAATSRFKSEFLANMSHELRTPLNSALILAKLLSDNKPGTLTDEQVQYAQAIYASNNDLLALINDILDLSKIEAGHVELAAEPIDLDALLDRLRQTFDPLARQKGLALAITAPPTLPRMVGDAQRLQQILTNLLSNAIKFTDAGDVGLTVDRVGSDRIAFAVRDTGIGIAPEQIDVVFEAFRQADGSTSRRYGGTGLGLSISRDLAHRMGGAIAVDSAPGRGSCFTLELPLDAGAAVDAPPARRPAPPATPRPASPPAHAPAPVAPAPVPDDRGALHRPGRLIMVVEDDPAFARALVDLVHERDFDCVVAGGADEALQLAARHAPIGILLDLTLPDASGLTVIERLKRDPATRHIPVHIVSALERSMTPLELGAVGYLMKPATREMLMSAIQRLEEQSERTVRRILIVEDDAELRTNLQRLLSAEQHEIVAVGSVRDAIDALSRHAFDCMVMDLVLSDGSGYELLERLARGDAGSFPPVIVYTGRALTRDEEQRLRRYSRSIIIKGARSPERLLDEVTLFLHSVEASLPADQQRLLQEARRRDTVLEGRRFLLAEDDPRNIFAVSSILEPLGVALEIARNGREAVERIERGDVDLVLMDVMMPEMDGLEAMRRIRALPHGRDVPIIALTAKAMPDDRAQCLDAGANDYIAKPIDVDKLVSLCRVWCSRR